MVQKIKAGLFILMVGGIFFLASGILRTHAVVDQLTLVLTDHFSIYFKGIYENEAQYLGKVLQENCAGIRTELDDPPHYVIHVFIHQNQQEFNEATGLAGNSKSHAKNRNITLYLKNGEIKCYKVTT